MRFFDWLRPEVKIAEEEVHGYLCPICTKNNGKSPFPLYYYERLLVQSSTCSFAYLCPHCESGFTRMKKSDGDYCFVPTYPSIPLYDLNLFCDICGDKLGKYGDLECDKCYRYRHLRYEIEKGEHFYFLRPKLSDERMWSYEGTELKETER